MADSLGPDRIQSIKDDLLRGETFSCHKTIYSEKNDPKMCAGAYLYLKKLNKPNQIMQVAERLGYQ